MLSAVCLEFHGLLNGQELQAFASILGVQVRTHTRPPGKHVYRICQHSHINRINYFDCGLTPSKLVIGDRKWGRGHELLRALCLCRTDQRSAEALTR